MNIHYAIIITHNRLELLEQCLNHIRPQVDQVLVIDNASNPPVKPQSGDWLMKVPDQPPNIANMWNQGLAWIEMDRNRSREGWKVAFLCDDVQVPEGWFETIATTMDQFGAAAGSTHQYRPISAPILKTSHDNDLYNRMCGWAFVLRGESAIRADEQFHWWWVDTDIDWRARQEGGMVLAPGAVAQNTRPNDYTYSVPGLADRAGKDGELFAAKWNGRPW